MTREDGEGAACCEDQRPRPQTAEFKPEGLGKSGRRCFGGATACQHSVRAATSIWLTSPVCGAGKEPGEKLCDAADLELDGRAPGVWGHPTAQSEALLKVEVRKAGLRWKTSQEVQVEREGVDDGL